MAAMSQSSSDPCPCCQTSSMIPHAAPMDRTLSTIALAGSSSERNARARSRKVRIEITAIMSGNEP